ncbi:hypothetical protein Mlaev_00001 [Microbacterium laevaniformans]|uniref:Uncharacterized protein n=1 Tax=Microbacterium laevaniformans TaxID=36807 RepID=A0A150HJE6_9MICO|nr:hypothetical protein [Microbacterium laevaniformans]KXZ61958.1 hypothetical protein Mlaev_00001 [Microbacterium laevaniformans]
MLNATFAAPCLTTFCRLDELGLEAVGQHLDADRPVIGLEAGPAALDVDRLSAARESWSLSALEK